MFCKFVHSFSMSVSFPFVLFKWSFTRWMYSHLMLSSFSSLTSKKFSCFNGTFFPASFHETCQWLKLPLNGSRAQSRVSPVVGLLPLASGPACFGMAFPAFLVKQLYCCDWVVISSFVRTGYTTRRWGWVLGRIGYSITVRMTVG